MPHDDLRRYRVTITPLPWQDGPQRIIVGARSAQHAARGFHRKRVISVERYVGPKDAAYIVDPGPSEWRTRVVTGLRWTARRIRAFWRWLSNKDAR
ncbi:hypothetical protein ACFWQL_11735 [Amycolatopsis thermoflava]|uniref:hypothetical protein n=1 Tax=Amycolatopsis thermoflava TaxID=84480 RepID=UPI0036692335